MDDLELRHIDTPVGKLCVRIHRAAASKAGASALVFWHSLVMDSHMWENQLGHFGTRYTMVFIDAPGHGRSEPLRAALSLQDCTDAVVAVLDALHIQKCISVGCSWGGMVAALVPAYHPTRCTGAIAMNTTLDKPMLLEQVVFNASAWLYAWGQAHLDALSQTVFRFIFRSGGGLAKQDAQRFNAHVASRIADADALSLSWALHSLVRRSATSYEEETARISVPVLVVAGDKDIELPVARVQKIAKQCKRGSFVCIQGSGHLSALDSPGQTNAAMDSFLKEHAL